MRPITKYINLMKRETKVKHHVLAQEKESYYDHLMLEVEDLWMDCTMMT